MALNPIDTHGILVSSSPFFHFHEHMLVFSYLQDDKLKGVVLLVQSLIFHNRSYFPPDIRSMQLQSLACLWALSASSIR